MVLCVRLTGQSGEDGREGRKKPQQPQQQKKNPLVVRDHAVCHIPQQPTIIARQLV